MPKRHQIRCTCPWSLTHRGDIYFDSELLHLEQVGAIVINMMEQLKAYSSGG